MTVYEAPEVCKLYETKTYEELHKAALTVTQDFGKERGIAISEILEKWMDGFSKDYDKYLESVRGRKKQQATKQVTEMRKKQEQLPIDILGVEGGYIVADVIEKKGIKVDWQKTPINVINRVKDIEFLTKKGYDFNQKQDFNGKKISFADYHRAFLAHYEELVVKDYNYLMKLVEYRNKLIVEYKKDKEEYKNPETTAARKKELEEELEADNQAYLKLRNAIPVAYKKVDGLMTEYFKHGVCLDHAVRNNLLSDDNLKKVDVETLTESMRNMFARDTRMKKLKTLIDKGQVNNTTNTQQDALALTEEYNIKENGLSGALSSSENAPALYANRKEEANSLLAAISPNSVETTVSDDNKKLPLNNGENSSQLAHLGTIVDNRLLIELEDESLTLGQNNTVRV